MESVAEHEPAMGIRSLGFKVFSFFILKVTTFRKKKNIQRCYCLEIGVYPSNILEMQMCEYFCLFMQMAWPCVPCHITMFTSYNIFPPHH